MKKIILPAKLENLERLMQFVSDFARGRGVDRDRIRKIELAVEEALTNIIRHAYSEKNVGDIEVSCEAEEDRLIVEISDTGIPFDIGSVAEPDVTPDVSERRPGGLGIFLIKKMVDEVHYRRDGAGNILTLVVHGEN